MCLDVNLNVSCQVRPVHAPLTGWSFLNMDAVPLGVKIAFPKDVFLTKNIGQEHCTALPSVLHWEPGPWDLSGGFSIASQMKSHSPLPALFEPTQGCHKCVMAAPVIGTPQSALKPSFATDKVWWSMLSGTPIFSSGEHSSDGHPSK